MKPTEEQIKEIEREAEAKIAGLQTELTVWKDTAEKLKEANEMMLNKCIEYQQKHDSMKGMLDKVNSNLQQRDELLDRADDFIGGLDYELLNLVLLRKWRNDYKNLKK